MNSFEKIDLYLDGELPENEQIFFEEELIKDHKLNAELQFHEEINESIIDDEVFLLRTKLGSIISESKIKPLFPTKIAVSVAVSVLVVVLSFLMFNKVDPITLYSDYYVVYEPNFTERSVYEDISMNELDFGIKLYKNKDYEAAVKFFENYSEQIHGNNTVLLYKSICYMELDNYTGAEDCLLDLINSDDYALVLHAKWYLSLLYIRTNKIEEAAHLLEQLSENRNYYSAKAQELLKKI